MLTRGPPHDNTDMFWAPTNERHGNKTKLLLGVLFVFFFI